jgi:hypothetical protein
MSENKHIQEESQRHEKPFPRFCPECGKIAVYREAIAYDAQIKHDNRLHAFHIPALQVNKCHACGEILFDTAAGTDMTEELADQLSEAGRDDGTPGMCCGVPVIGFSREADCLETAIRSAVADVQKAGCVVERVQIEHDSPLLSSGGG